MNYEFQFRNTIARLDTFIGGKRKETIKVNREQLNEILSSSRNLESIN